MAQKNKKKRGFSLAETAIALAVIAIVSGAAMSMVLSSADIEGNTMLKSYVISDAENVLDCFRYAETVEEFKAVLNKANPSDSAGNPRWKEISDSIEASKRIITYELEQENYTVTLVLTLADTASDNIQNTDTLSFSAENRREESVMTGVTFTKQGVASDG